MKEHKYYLRNPNLSNKVIKKFIKEDCSVGTTCDGWEIIERKIGSDCQDTEGVTYINILIKDLNKREIKEINKSLYATNDDIYLECLCYPRW